MKSGSLINPLALALILSCATISHASTTQAGGNDSFDSVAAQARAAMTEDRVPEAIRLYIRATSMRPTWSEGWWHLGTLEFDSGHFAEAHDAFGHFVTSEHREPGPGFAMLGLSDFQLKRYTESLQALERGIQLGLGDNFEFVHTVLYHAGILHARFGQPELALVRLTLAANQMAAAHREAPDQTVFADTDLVTAFGIAALRIPLLPSELPAAKLPVVRLAGHAQAFIALQDRVSAGADFKELLTLYPSVPGVHYMYGVFLEKEHPPLAMDQFRREIEVNPKDAVARIQLALEYLRLGDYEKGLPFAQQATTMAPRNFIAHVAYGNIALELGKTAQAVQELRTAVRLAPGSPDAHLALSRALLQAGQKAQAAHERSEFERLKAQEDRASR